MCTSRTIPARRCSSTTTVMGRSRRSDCRRAWRSRQTAARRPAWASAPATTTAMAGSTSSRRTSTTTRRRCIATWEAERSTMRRSPEGWRSTPGIWAGARGSSTSTWTPGRTSSSSTAMSIRRPIASGGNYSYAQPKLLYRNLGNGRFEDVSMRAGPGLLARKASRGAAFGDLFNTGQQDVVVNNMHDPPSLLHNCAPARGPQPGRGAGGNTLEPQRHRGAGHCAPGRPAVDRRGAQRRQFLFAQRFADPRWPRRTPPRRPHRRRLAERRRGDDRRRRCGSARGHS